MCFKRAAPACQRRKNESKRCSYGRDRVGALRYWRAAPADATKVVVAVAHNGLGNQLFQYRGRAEIPWTSRAQHDAAKAAPPRALDGLSSWQPRRRRGRSTDYPAGSRAAAASARRTIQQTRRSRGRRRDGARRYAFGRLAALETGASFAARKMYDREGPMAPPRVPPHTIEGWNAFKAIFGEGAGGDTDTMKASCAELTPTKKEYAANGTTLLVERPADARRLAFAKQLRAFAEALDSKEPACLTIIGYWQRYALYAGLRGPLRDAMPLAETELSEDPGPDDVVVHARGPRGPRPDASSGRSPSIVSPGKKLIEQGSRARRSASATGRSTSTRTSPGRIISDTSRAGR